MPPNSLATHPFDPRVILRWLKKLSWFHLLKRLDSVTRVLFRLACLIFVSSLLSESQAQARCLTSLATLVNFFLKKSSLQAQAYFLVQKSPENEVFVVPKRQKTIRKWSLRSKVFPYEFVEKIGTRAKKKEEGDRRPSKGTGKRQFIYRIYSINRPGRLLNFGTLKSRWALIWGWALIKFSTFSAGVVCLFCNKTVNVDNKTRRCKFCKILWRKLCLRGSLLLVLFQFLGGGKGKGGGRFFENVTVKKTFAGTDQITWNRVSIGQYLMKTGIGQSKYRNFITLFHVFWSVPAKVFLAVTFSILSILTDHDLVPWRRNATTTPYTSLFSPLLWWIRRWARLFVHGFCSGFYLN